MSHFCWRNRYFYAAVIARVRLRSVSAAPTQRGDKGNKCNFHYSPGLLSIWLEKLIMGGADAQRDDDEGRYYNNGIVYTFDVIEYLKGEGDGELVVLEPALKRGPVECRERFDTEEAALEAAVLALERRDTRWEDREAIIFVQANFYPNQDAAKGSYPYEFISPDPYSRYGSVTYKAWLPAAEAGGVAPVSGQAAGAMRFLSATPNSEVAEAAAPRTLAELRTLVAEAVEDYRTGSAEHGEELYKQCLIQKYVTERRARGGLYHRSFRHHIDSGLPAGTQIIDPDHYWSSRNGPSRRKPPIGPIGLKEGRDAHLFSTDPTMFYTVRPLPRRQYRFYHTVFDPNWLTICGGDVMPEAMRKSAEDIVEVTAPEGVVHEAFFDPVASGDAVGAGGADGVLTGAGFTLRHSTFWRATRNGCHTIIRRIEWESGRVVMRLEPDDNALAGHHVDFISLDGSVALRLDFDDAVEATSGGAPALAWSVRNQPWSEGDLLMLRISRSEANLIGASGDAECPPPGPPAPPSAPPSGSGAEADGSATHAPTVPVRGESGDLWADVILGQPDFSEITPNQVVPFKVFNPGGVVVDRATDPGRAYVWDSGNSRILGIDLDKCYAGPSPCSAEVVLGQPSGYDHSACNGDGALQNFPIRALADPTTLCGVPDVSESPWEHPSFVSMAVDSESNLYVPDVHNNRVLKYEAPFDNDSVADEVWGQEDFTGIMCNRGDLVAPTAESICFVSYTSAARPGGWWGNGVDVDPAGNLWVADAGNNRVLRFPVDATTGQIAKSADLVLGQHDFRSWKPAIEGCEHPWCRDQEPGLDSMYSPSAVRVDVDGVVHVADNANDRVLVFEPPLASGMAATRTFGSNFDNPNSLAIDPSSRGLWVNNPGNGMIELWNWDGTEVLMVLARIHRRTPMDGVRAAEGGG